MKLGLGPEAEPYARSADRCRSTNQAAAISVEKLTNVDLHACWGFAVEERSAQANL